MEQTALQSLSAALLRHMTQRARSGQRWAYRSGTTASDAIPVSPEPAADASQPLEPALIARDPGPRPAGQRLSLAQIREELGEDCSRCKLSAGRTQIVFGVGNPHARLMFVGEGPGRDEDEQGEPFVGAAGQLLTRIIEAIGLTREDVYIANVVKCRPPGNRNPEPDEIEACRPFLEKQIESIGPKLLVGLGNIAVKSLLEVDTGIMRMRGNWREYRGIPFMPTIHPSYVLRNEAEGRRMIWDDFRKVAERYNEGLPPGEKPARIKTRETRVEASTSDEEAGE